MLRQLIVIRHGDFDDGTTNLNSDGIKQVENIANILIPFMGDHEKIALISSVGPRAIESAKIISNRLGIPFEIREEFGSSRRNNQHMHYPAAINYISKLNESMAVVIVVTKGEYANGFVDFYAFQVLNTTSGEQQLERGTGIIIDCQTKQLKSLVPTP